MTIIQLSKPSTTTDPDTGEPLSRAVTFYISNNGEAYIYNRGGLPLEGNVQTMLEAEEAELFLAAQANGVLPTATQIEIVGAILYYQANPGMKAAVFDKSITQTALDVTALVNSISGLGVAQKAGLVQILMSSLLDTRVNAHDRNLV